MLKYPSGNMSCILHANCIQAALRTLKTEGDIDMQIIFLSAGLEVGGGTAFYPMFIADCVF
jgi:hypothetical protein